MPRGRLAGTVVCPQPLAAAAGGQILERGGNAMDAAVAAAFAQGVVDPLMCGLGGLAQMLVYRASDQQVVFVDAAPRAGARAAPNSYRYLGPDIATFPYMVEGYENYVGYRASTVPSLVRGLWDGHARFGSLPWRDLLQPAIELAANGFQVYPYLYRSWEPKQNEGPGGRLPARMRLGTTAESARIYLRDGEVYATGELLAQPDYATTLRRIADEGAEVFYRGDVARAIAEDFERHGGLFTAQDLANCSSTIRQPTVGTYREYTIVTDSAPGGGPVMIEALNILEQFDLRSLGWQSPLYLDLLARVFQTVYADRYRYMADPAFEEVPLDLFLSKQRAKALAAGIRQGNGLPAAEAVADQQATTHVSVLDGQGNAVSLMQSNGSASGVVTPGLGFLYNNHMLMFDPRPGRRNCVESGKTPRYGASPTLYFCQGVLWAISGSLSIFRMTAEVQVLVSMIDFGIDAQGATSQPRIHAGFEPNTLYAEPEVPQQVLSSLQSLGWKTVVTTMTAPLCMIAFDRKEQARPVVDPRGGGGHWPACGS